MPPKEVINPPRGASTVVVPSAFHFEGGEQTEIAAQISIPEEGGWGWVVMVTSFLSIAIMDGVVFTFGALFADIRDDMKVEEYLVALVNSAAFGMYFTSGPIASAIINRFGFRECTMAGSVISSVALIGSSYAPNYLMLFMFYGVMNGFGAALIAMSSNLVVGFYFEKLRSVVMAIAGSGASVGMTILFYVNSHLTNLIGWRGTTIFHAGLCGIIYFLGMTYRPLISVFVKQTTADETIPTVTYLPNLSAKNVSAQQSSAPERILKTVSNAHFPTAAAVIKEGIITTTTDALPQPGSSTAATSTVAPSPSIPTKLSMTAHCPAGVRPGQIESLRHIATASQNPTMPVELTLQKPFKKIPWWRRCCFWEKRIAEARPMYRDDAFYAGNVKKLDVYKKSVLDVAPESRTGLEYQMAVTRTVTTKDLEEKRGVFSTAFKRVLVTMMDPSLLKKLSFLTLCFSGFCTYSGFLVPYVFLKERNQLEGIDPEHCTMLLSVISFTNLVGRIFLGILAVKVDPIKIYTTACLMSGIATIASNFSFNVYYQYACGSVFGFFIASLVSLRSMVLVSLYGIDMLTNATGVMVVFQGIGGLISTPLGSIFKTIFGYAGPFYLAGVFMLTSGLALLPTKMLVNIEKKADEIRKTEKVESDIQVLPQIEIKSVTRKEEMSLANIIKMKPLE